MRSSSGKISNSILWLCMMVTVGIFAFFYFSGTIEVPGSDIPEPKHVSALLYWVDIILVITIAALLLFAAYRFYCKIKEDPKSAWKSLAMIIFLTLLMVAGYSLGDDTPVQISGYDGKENTPVWLKLTDMWLYAIYVLMGLTILAVFAGIFWSYIKKIR